MKTRRITKKDIGRPVDFYGCNRHENIVCHGRIADVTKGLVVIADPSFPGIHPPTNEPWASVLMPTNSPKIVQVW